MSKKFDAAVIAAARAMDIDVVGIEKHRGHPKLVFILDGHVRRHPIPCTPSCQRALDNTVTGLRRHVRRLRKLNS